MFLFRDDLPLGSRHNGYEPSDFLIHNRDLVSNNFKSEEREEENRK